MEDSYSSSSTGDEPCNTSSRPPELHESESLPLEWTNEKHSQYLKSMEASFVNQLYDSMEVLGWGIDKENSSNVQSRRHHNKCIYSPSGQFKVLGDGCWKKINSERPCSVSNTGAKSHVILRSPWIQHFRSNSRPHVSSLSDISKVASLTDHCVDTKEVSDQNFVDDDAEASGQDGSFGEKRSKTLRTNALTNDQDKYTSHCFSWWSHPEELVLAETTPRRRNNAPHPCQKFILHATKTKPGPFT